MADVDAYECILCSDRATPTRAEAYCNWRSKLARECDPTDTTCHDMLANFAEVKNRMGQVDASVVGNDARIKCINDNLAKLHQCHLHSPASALVYRSHQGRDVARTLASVITELNSIDKNLDELESDIIPELKANIAKCRADTYERAERLTALKDEYDALSDKK